MKVRKLFRYILTILLVASGILYLNKMGDALGIAPDQIESTSYKLPGEPKFIHLGGGSFKTIGSKPVYADDCIGCGEIGDISVYHNSESAEWARYTFDANCNGEFKVVQKGDRLDENGKKIGERCIAVFNAEHSRIVWTESEKDLWIISAPTVELLQAFEKSEVYKLNKSAVD